MSKSSVLREKFAENLKAKEFITRYVKANDGAMPAMSEVNVAKVLTSEEKEALEFNARIGNMIARSGEQNVAVWDYIYDEDSWNAAYNKENSSLKAYLDRNPDEDRYNFNENRWAWEADKVDGEWPDYCRQCWQGAISADGAKYPWCVVNIKPFEGNIKFNYDGGADVWPWGENIREFKRTYAIASIPIELGEEFLLVNGETSFDPSKLVVTLIYA